LTFAVGGAASGSGRRRAVAARAPAARGSGNGGSGDESEDDDGAPAADSMHGVHSCVCPCKARAVRRLSSKAGKRRRALAVLGFTKSTIPAHMDGDRWVARGHFDVVHKKGAVPTLWWSWTTGTYEVVPPDARTPATVRSSGRGLSSLRALRASKNLRIADRELVETAESELRQTLRSHAELERDVQLLRQQLASAEQTREARREWAPFGGGGCSSPCFRFAAFRGDTAACLRVFGLGSRTIEALAKLLETFGFGDDKGFETASFRASLVRAGGVDGAAHSAESVRFSNFRSLPAVRGAGGARRRLLIVDMLTHSLYILKHDASIKHAGFLFGVGETTSSNYFIQTITALDKCFFIMYPPLSADDSRLLTPISAKGKVGDPAASLFAADAAERQALMPMDGGTQAMYYSNYKKTHTHKLKVLVHIGGFPVWVSDAYTGVAGDDEILIAEWKNILRFVPHGSTIFVDKGYHTGRLMEMAVKAGIRIVAPPRKVDNVEFTSLQLQSTQKVANIRIVVETVIGAVSQRWRFFRNGRHSVHLNDIVSAAYRVCFFLESSFPPRNQSDTMPLKSETAAVAAEAAAAVANVAGES
jgi:hypothetical protein